MDASDSAVDRLIYQFHIPKTGGRTIEKFLSTPYRPRVLDPRRNRAFIPILKWTTRVVDPATPSKPHVIGHYASFSFIARCPEAYLKVCFWRHPADWMLSFYNYPAAPQPAHVRAVLRFRELLQVHAAQRHDRAPALHCGDVSGLRYFFMSDRAKFLAAMRLVERFDMFQDISTVDAFLAMVRGEGEGKPEDYNRIETSAKVRTSLDPELRQRLAATNLIDTYLHRVALGEDRARITEEANRTLASKFDPRDLWRLARLPLYRLSIWVLPRWRFAGPAGTAASPQRRWIGRSAFVRPGGARSAAADACFRGSDGSHSGLRLGDRRGAHTRSGPMKRHILISALVGLACG